jgi:hypothetical protein
MVEDSGTSVIVVSSMGELDSAVIIASRTSDMGRKLGRWLLLLACSPLLCESSTGESAGLIAVSSFNKRDVLGGSAGAAWARCLAERSIMKNTTRSRDFLDAKEEFILCSCSRK